MLIELATLFTSASLAYVLRDYYAKWQKKPTKARVIATIQQFSNLYPFSDQLSEAELEYRLAEVLALRFDQVSTQFSLKNGHHARERIDIDLGDGYFGIEIKKAQSLRRSNERNRLLGQIDLYHSRGYTADKLLILLAGKPSLAEHQTIQELIQLLEQKKTSFLYLKTQ